MIFNMYYCKYKWCAVNNKNKSNMLYTINEKITCIYNLSPKPYSTANNSFYTKVMKAIMHPIDNTKTEPPQAVRVNRVGWHKGKIHKSDYDLVASEQPLQLLIQWQTTPTSKFSQQVFTITMRTVGNDFALVAGLLHNEGIISSKNDISAIESTDENQIQVTLNQRVASQIKTKLAASDRQLVSHSSCGLCGKTSLKALELQSTIRLDDSQSWLAPEQICQLPDKLRAQQSLFAQTGGVHGVALFDRHYQLIKHHEDIGRHNALDKVIGSLLLDKNEPDDKTIADKNILVLSGRVSFELIQKALMAGFPVCVAVGAPSSLAIEAAIRFDMTLIGFTKADGFNIYSGQWRLVQK